MTEQENVQLVKKLFSLFNRGDLERALELFSDEVDFRSPVSEVVNKIPWAKPRHGREEVAEFFKELIERFEIEPFEINQIVAEKDMVAVEGSNGGRIRVTDVPYEHNWVMVLSFQGGKISRCWHYYDSADLMETSHKD